MSDIICRNSRVDVLGSDHLLRSGRLGSIFTNGILIDFHCSNPRCRFVPFNRIFYEIRPSIHHTLEYRLADAYCEAKPGATIPVEALMPETPVGPWALFRAGIVNIARGIRHTACKCRVAVVQWIHGGVQSTDLVPLKRLRWRLTSDWESSVGRMDSAQPPSVDNWHVDGSKFHGISTLLTPVERGNFPKRSLLLLQYCKYRIGKRLSRCDIAGMLSKASTSFVEQQDSVDMHVLSSAVLLEMFSHLDSRTQTGLCSVCWGWNTILQSPVLAVCIVVSSSHGSEPSDESKYNWLQYFLTVPVFKCLRKSTQHIIVDARNSLMDGGDFLTLTDVINYVGREKGCRLRTIHIVGLHYDLAFNDPLDSEKYGSHKCLQHRCPNGVKDMASFSPFTRLVDFIAACGGFPCDAIHLVKCAIDFVCAKIGSRNKIQLSVNLVDIRFPMRDDIGCVMWDAMEKSVPVPDGKQMETLAVWLKSITADTKERLFEDRGLACKALCATQLADPRPSSYYRGKVWCVDGLQGLVLEKLSPIALHFLVELAQQWTTWNIDNDRW